MQVRRFSAGSKSDEIKQCHLAFVNGEERGNTNDYVEWLHRSHVLTVTERLSSGIINFYLHRGKVRFDIDPKQANRAGVYIARRLIKISKQS